MSAVLPAVLLALFMSACADAQVRRLAVYSEPAQGFSTSSFRTIEQELQRVLTPAGIDVAWRPVSKDRGYEEFELLVVGSFEGACSVDELSFPPASPRTKILGETQVSAGGRVLPFFRVDCTRIVGTLWPALQRLNAPLRQVVFGRAVARVIAHEIYHVVAQAMDHSDLGITKPSLSIDDLTAEHFGFDTASLERMQPMSSPIPFTLSGAVLPRE